MKSKTISNSKYRNSSVLFELLVHQVTAETMKGAKRLPSLEILNKYFNSKTEIGKELQLYRALCEGGSKPLTETKALDFIDLVIRQRKKLDEKKLAREKYNLVKEIKENYNLKEFLSYRIPNYTLYASIYKTFMNEVVKDQSYSILNVKDIATARFTIVENLLRKPAKKEIPTSDALLEEYRKESEEMRLLAYKFAVDKFNEKYTSLNDKQKSLLREFINDVPSEKSLLLYVTSEIPSLKLELINKAKQVKDKIVSIKLHEVAKQLDTIVKKSVIKDGEITALMIAYEILKEVS